MKLDLNQEKLKVIVNDWLDIIFGLKHFYLASYCIKLEIHAVYNNKER